MRNRDWFITAKGRRVGLQTSRVSHGGAPYLDRTILYLGGFNVRLHKFWRGDDDRAPHDHPWAFVTFPLTSYVEKVGDEQEFRLVKRFNFHYRPAEFKHIVVGGVSPHHNTRMGVNIWNAYRRKKPFYTIVFAGSIKRRWGFWPDKDTFVFWRDWR